MVDAIKWDPPLNIVIRGIDGGADAILKAGKDATRVSARKVSVQASKKTREIYNVTAGLIKDTFFTVVENSGQTRTLTYKGKRLGLVNFDAKSKKINRRQGVTVKIRKDRGRTPVKGAFFFETGGGVQVAKRKGPARFPIQVLKTIAVPEMLDTDPVLDQMENTVEVAWNQEFIRSMNFRLKKLGFI